MNTIGADSTSLFKIVPLTGAALAVSLVSAHGLVPIAGHEGVNPVLTVQPPAAKTLSEKELTNVEPTVQGIGWTSSDAWFFPVRESIYGLLSLRDNWDSYGASAVKQDLAATAADILQSIMDPDTRIPAVVPTTRGGIQIEWHASGIDLEIEIESTARITAFYEDSATGLRWERELTSDLHTISCITARLSTRTRNKA